MWKREIGQKFMWNRDLQFLSWSWNSPFSHMNLWKLYFNRDVDTIYFIISFSLPLIPGNIYQIMKLAILWHENVKCVIYFLWIGYPYSPPAKLALNVPCDLHLWPGNVHNIFPGWETSARPLANASENLAGWVENSPGRVEFCIGYIRHYPVRASAKKFKFPSLSSPRGLYLSHIRS